MLQLPKITKEGIQMQYFPHDHKLLKELIEATKEKRIDLIIDIHNKLCEDVTRSAHSTINAFKHLEFELYLEFAKFAKIHKPDDNIFKILLKDSNLKAYIEAQDPYNKMLKSILDTINKG